VDVGLRAGDICPALDVEDDPNVATIAPAWQEQLRTFLGGMMSSFGEAMVYVTQRDFGRLGKPDFVLDRPLWVAHYTPAPLPATPGGKPCVIWQRRVGPFDPSGPGGAFAPDGSPARAGHPPGPLDQDAADGELPRCLRAPTGGTVVTGGDEAAPAFTHDELRAMRMRDDLWFADFHPEESPAQNLNEESQDEEQ
jgi:hypothetical protein